MMRGGGALADLLRAAEDLRRKAKLPPKDIILGAVLTLFALVPAIYLSNIAARNIGPRARLCPCEDLDNARQEMENFIANVTKQDIEAAGKDQSAIQPLKQTMKQQQYVLEDQAEELMQLKEAAKARDRWKSREYLMQKKFTVNVVEEDHPELWQQRTFRKHASWGFVSYSSYRLSPTLIIVVGLGTLKMRGNRRLYSCHWVSDSGQRTEGKLGIESMNEHHWYLYELLLLNCTLPDPPKQEEEGGMDVSHEGGHLEVHLDQEFFYPYVEKTGYKIHKMDSNGPFQYESVFCGPPMFGELSLKGILQWVAYHRYHAGFDHFFLYDSGAFTNEFRLAFNHLVDEGIVTVQDFREALQYDIWAQNQALAMHDCLFRNRETARWVWYHDLDEYLEAPPTSTVPGILRKYMFEPYLTHGSYVYSLDNCEVKDVWDPALTGGKMAVELLLDRWDKPYCIKDDMDPQVCTDYYGMRKIVANPRKVQRTYIHHTAIPWSGGVDLPVRELWHSHFKRLIQPSRACSQEKEHNDGLRRVTSLADIAARARQCAREGFTNEAKCRPGLEP